MRRGSKMIGVLDLQGAVPEHLAAIKKLGYAGLPVKTPADLDKADALIIPGGESTAISRLMRENALFKPIRDFSRKRPVLGTCAGLILCASEILGQNEDAQKVAPLGLLDCAVSRNGFGRQANSFETMLSMDGIGDDIPAVFIRAPYIERAGPSVKVLARISHAGFHGVRIVAAECGNVLVTSFHPELTGDLRVMDYFCSKIPR